ncbi:hypothetical protein PVAP13_3KG087200 [Panicum virgatum]|uniref:Uncharacterized protein n=1 Tax=Panicum virgatum TaxID=38727 RepID=A0A8T0UUS4_PANVG|nr:hypothetical protein PVAP13_3KG087200 [Panicum virgatum]
MHGRVMVSVCHKGSHVTASLPNPCYEGFGELSLVPISRSPSGLQRKKRKPAEERRCEVTRTGQDQSLRRHAILVDRESSHPDDLQPTLQYWCCLGGVGPAARLYWLEYEGK